LKSPRDYQRAAVDAIYSYWEKPKSKHGIVVIPTAGGKSLVMALLIKELSERWPGTRILCLTHVQELIEQDHAELIDSWPEAPAGIYSAGLGRKDHAAPILFAGIQSIEKTANLLNPPPEIVLVDECHLIPRNEQTRYMRTLDILAVMYPSLRVVGFTATPYRMDSGWLHKGDGAMFQDIIYSVEPQYLIDQGYLAPVFARAGAVKIDTSSVHKRGGEFISGELEKAAMSGDTTAVAVADFIERGRDRKKWLVFVTGLAHAEQVYQAVINEGVTADVVTGTTPKAQRKKIVEEFKCGQIKCLINIDVLTTGFNCRDLDMIVMLRPTGSPSLYVQMVGRGMRTAPGKTDCLLLDFSANVVRHGPIDAVDPEAPGKGEGVAPAKECVCGAIIAAGFRVCPVCGHEFPAPEPKIASRPVAAPVLKSQILPQEYTVTGCRYARHVKQGKRDSVRVEYTCGFLTFKEWVFPDAATPQLAFYYGKYMTAAGIAYKNWPRTVEAFLASPPRSPSRIWVTQEGKFDRVARKEYGEGAPEVDVDTGISIKKRYDMVAEEREPAVEEYLDEVPF
jgi:DNA repair protein RadD